MMSLYRSAQRFLVTTLLILLPSALEAQGSRVQNNSPGAVADLRAEDVFTRFAKRILFLTCDESANESALASGVLVSADGLVVTNAHVVEECRSVSATYINGASRRTFQAALKYYDSQTDTAVLRIDSEQLDYFNVQTRRPRIGERVYAIGNPRGLEQSISEGIISGYREDSGATWIQHSAPISPGSSGGALISSRGELLGINSFLLTNSQNLNFAVPASTLAQAVLRARAQTESLKLPVIRYLTGTYSGTVQNLTAGVSSNFRIVIAENKGQIRGCMIVQPPLVGSGYITGIATSSHISFSLVSRTLAGDSLVSSFEGKRDGDSLSGSFTDSVAKRSLDHYGTFLVSKTSSEGPVGAPGIQTCPNDVTVIREAGEREDASAQVILGDLYYSGGLVDKDYSQAAAWYLKAAQNGNANAQASMALLYSVGEGVSQNLSEAYFWLSIAATGQIRNVKPGEVESALAQLVTQLPPETVTQVQRRVREWRGTHPAVQRQP